MQVEYRRRNNYPLFTQAEYPHEKCNEQKNKHGRAHEVF